VTATGAGDPGTFETNRRYNYGWLGYGLPYYPYLIDPGFYDWGDDSDTSASEQGDSAPAYASPYPGHPGQGYAAQDQQPYWPTAAPSSPSSAAAASAPQPEQPPLTVIFKDGRAPVKMQNYMMTAKTLTDLDAHHYEQIPLDQVDKAATRRMNSAAGVDFQIPEATSD